LPDAKRFDGHIHTTAIRQVPDLLNLVAAGK
jgi:hypothetical protein